MKRAILCFCVMLILGSCVAKSPIVPQEPQLVKISIDSNQPIERINVENPGECGEDKISRAMEVKNPEGQLSGLTFISGDVAYLKIFSGIGVVDQINIWNDFIVLKDTTDIRLVKLFISSPGGGAFDGLGIADQIERAKDMGFEVEAHASGIVASAAVPIFAVCTRRYAAPGTIFMVHQTSMFKFGMENAQDIRAQNELMELLRDRYLGKLVQYSDLTRDQWEAMEKKTTWFNADQAMQYGLVDEIK